MYVPSNTLAPPGEGARTRTPARAASMPALCVVVLIAAFFSLAMQIGFWRTVGMGPGFESISVAKSLALKGTFADPFDGPTGPTAHLAPLWPFVLAGMYRAAGSEAHFRVMAFSVTIVLHALNVLFLFLLAHELLGNWLSRYCTVALALMVPLYQVIPPSDAICVSAGLLAFWLLARRRRLILCGLFGGLLLLFSPAVLFILAPIAAYEWKRVKAVGVFLAIALVVILPWEIRNYSVFHKVFFIRDNLGLELDVYNNDCEIHGTGGCVPHPMLSAEERARIAAMGEASYDEMRMHHALGWFKTHPGQALRLVAGRIAGFWFPIRAAAPYGFCIAAITLLSLWGCWRLLRDRRQVFWPMLAISVLYPPVYYLVRFDLRYRYTILWVSILAAGYGAARLIEGLGSWPRAPGSARGSRARWGTAAHRR